MRRISVLFLCCLALALPAMAGGPYFYYFQVGPENPPGVTAWSASWQSDTLLIPGTCTPYIELDKQPDFALMGSPYPDYSLHQLIFCAGGGVPSIAAYWTEPLPPPPSYVYPSIAYSAYFSPAKPPVTLGIFKAASTELDFERSSVLYSPPITLVISQRVAPPPVPVWSGSIIRLSLTVAGPVTPPPGTPVEAVVGFVDLNGNLIGQPLTVPLILGQAVPVELNSDAIIHALGEHANVRPVISAAPDGFLPPVQLTTEVFDGATGFGRVLTTTSAIVVPPASLAPQGLAGGQVMRITATAYSPDSCVATLSFADRQGNPIGTSLAVDLNPGQSQPLDLDASSLNLQNGQRMEVQPMITSAAPVLPSVGVVSSACTVSSEVFDRSTGRTWTYQTAALP